MSVALVSWGVRLLRGSELVETAPGLEALEPPEKALDPHINLPVEGVTHLLLAPWMLSSLMTLGALTEPETFDSASLVCAAFMCLSGND